jgi:hypothetical protein
MKHPFTDPIRHQFRHQIRYRGRHQGTEGHRCVKMPEEEASIPEAKPGAGSPSVAARAERREASR